jgi:hypothetical protein
VARRTGWALAPTPPDLTTPTGEELDLLRRAVDPGGLLAG